jgi:hypothetical protein
MNDSEALIKATTNIYKESLVLAIKSCVLNWHVPLFHLVLLIAVMLIGQFAQIFGRLIGGFLLGIVAAMVVASYFSLVKAAADSEKIRYQDMWSRMTELFFPIINVLFFFFLFNFVIGLVVSKAGNEWILASINLLLAVFLNPLPEVVARSGAYATQVFYECIDFIKENFVEWYIPIFLLLSPLLLWDFGQVKEVTILFLSTNPLYLLEVVFFGFGKMLLMLGNVLVILVLFYSLFLVFVFRAILYTKLSSSTRRKRIYQFKHS